MSDWFVSYCSKIRVFPETFMDKEAIRKRVIFEWFDLGIISPWRVISTISHHMIELYNSAKYDVNMSTPPFNLDSNKLPIEVMLNDKIKQHFVTEDFCFGILLFAKLSGSTYKLSMFGQPLDFDIVNNQYTLNDWDDFRQYKMIINQREFVYFDSEEFIRGFVTGSDLCKFDHRLYWEKFYSLNEYEEYEEIEFDKICD
jgi:hypothetical protein